MWVVDGFKAGAPLRDVIRWTEIGEERSKKVRVRMEGLGCMLHDGEVKWWLWVVVQMREGWRIVAWW